MRACSGDEERECWRLYGNVDLRVTGYVQWTVLLDGLESSRRVHRCKVWRLARGPRAARSVSLRA